MYSGDLKTVRFAFTGVLEALLDKLPTAQIEKEVGGGVIVTAEVFGNGIDMWLRSQGDRVKVLEEGDSKYERIDNVIQNRKINAK